VASFVGHSSVRTWVLGEEATRRAATDGEVAQMRGVVLEALRSGAIGFATSTLEQHNGENGVPMPSRLADDHEMLALTGALGEAGRGVFMLTKGMTTTIPWLEEVAARNRRPVMIAAMFVDPGDPERVFRELREVEAARGRDHELWRRRLLPARDGVHAAAPLPLEALIAWRPRARGGERGRLPPRARRPGVSPGNHARGRAARGAEPLQRHALDHLTIAEVKRPQHRAFQGKTIGQLARDSGREPVDCFLDLGLADDLDTLLMRSLQHRREAGVRVAAPPVRGGGAVRRRRAPVLSLRRRLGLHLFGHWVRERGDLSLEDAVRAVTSTVARAYRIKDRGRLVPGAWAISCCSIQDGRPGLEEASQRPAYRASRLDTPAVGSTASG